VRGVCAAILLLASISVASCGTVGPTPMASAVFPPPPIPEAQQVGIAPAYLDAPGRPQTFSAGSTYNQTRQAVTGVCFCPYDRRPDGSLCDVDSEFYRAGGSSPQCYIGAVGRTRTQQATVTSPTQGIYEPSYRPTYQPTYTPPRYGCAENGSCYGDISATTGRPKTVSVGGYYRKDGTYVRGHYRSKPRRRY
jgi:hypothetical protein